jgi:AP-2 complex subunit alpha
VPLPDPVPTQAGGESIKNVNKSNAIQAVMVEAVGLVMVLDRDLELVDQTAIQLGRFISAKEPNTKYLGLENMGRMSAIPQVAAAVKRNQQEIADSLHDADISIRRRALDLLFGMCDASNAQDIVQQLLDYLVVADFAIREELVLKIAILAEKFAPAVQQTQQHWYIDVMLTLVDKAGDFVSDDVWWVSPLRRLHTHASGD